MTSSKFLDKVAIQSLLVGVAGCVMSLLRIVVPNRSALQTVLWAEDGLFPLCVRNNGMTTCLLEPYGGSMHFLPKMLAGIVAMTPLQVWPLAANLLAGALAGFICGLVYLLTIRAKCSRALALALSMTPVLHASVGAESINSYGNSYVLVAYLFCVVYLIPQILTITTEWFLWIFTLVSVLTLPSLVLVVPIAVLADAKRIVPKRRWILSFSAMFAAVLVQLRVITQSTNARSPGFSRSSLGNWLVHVPEKVVESLLGEGRASKEVLRVSTLNTIQFAGAAVLLFSLLCLLVIYKKSRWSPAAAMMLSGLVLSAVPSVLFFPVSRYFVWLQLLVVASINYVLLSWSRIRILNAVLVLTVFLPSVGGFPAREFRVSTEYRWDDSLTSARDDCEETDGLVAEVLFAPGWPIGAVRNSLTTNTNNIVRCSDLD